MKVAFCGGGTGGHVYPALTVAAALRELAGPDLGMLYIGVEGKPDAELVAREGIPFRAVKARPLRTGDVRGSVRGAASLAAGTAAALGILREFRPDVVFATGGYGSAGVGMAARMLRRPLLLFLPDVEAGLAVRALTRLADRIAVTVPPALNAVPRGKATLTGYPVRRRFFEAEREASRRRLGLHAALPVLLVSGASSGANAINRAVAGFAADFLAAGQILHLCGRADEAWLRALREEMPRDLRERYHIYAYLHEDMADGLAAADLAVMRSGASTLGELPAARLPAVLVPGEYEGWDQSPNARFLEGEGAAVMLPQSRMEAELASLVRELLGDRERLRAMSESLARLARPDAARDLAELVLEMARQRVKAMV